MVVINIYMVLGGHNSLIKSELTYPDADRWAWDMMQIFDNGKLSFEPPEDEKLIWELIQFLYGIDMPDIEDRNKTARTNIDIEDFLRSKNLYEKAMALN